MLRHIGLNRKPYRSIYKRFGPLSDSGLRNRSIAVCSVPKGHPSFPKFPSKMSSDMMISSLSFDPVAEPLISVPPRSFAFQPEVAPPAKIRSQQSSHVSSQTSGHSAVSCRDAASSVRAKPGEYHPRSLALLLLWALLAATTLTIHLVMAGHFW